MPTKKKQQTGDTAGTKQLAVFDQENAIEVSSKIDINMDQLVMVGTAHIERTLKGKIKDLMSVIRTLRSELKIAEKKLPVETENALPKDVLASKQKLESLFKLLKIEHVNLVVSISIDVENEVNQYQLDLQAKKKSSYGRDLIDEMLLIKSSCNLTESQKLVMEQINGIKEKLDEKNEVVVELRRKLADVDSMERQMRARVVESQLSKTEQGKDLLESIMAKFDEDIELMG